MSAVAQKHEVIQQAAIATPSVAAVIATKVFELPLETWVGVTGIVFILLQAAYLVWKWRRDIKRERERVESRLPPPESDRAGL